MGLLMTLSDVEELSAGIWLFELPPHQMAHFGKAQNSIGATSAILFKSCSFESKTRQLQFEAENVVPTNVGTSSRTIGFLSESLTGRPVTKPREINAETALLGPGDRAFLDLTKKEMSQKMHETALALLKEVRSRSPGNLKRGQSRNFSETPDNFWYVIVQPQIDELSITVRGTVGHFANVSKLEIKNDRGNTRFKVRNLNDIPEAVALIFHAVRKPS
ncbi:hypothetical protein [Aestuariivirga litoralis]|uniref:hypothetical protein n=1 Tax=Aestuariivirga litoralis TaxID=2650924 RepID=UPI0018C5E4D8|nr:hypothetical protein [Aestuariivirga litoralis]MBG1232701.1 hypothetical protein [Aestuariivirga litoralis]